MLRQSLLTAALALVFGFLGAGLFSWTGMADSQTRAYLLENPEILPEMADAWQRKEGERKLASVTDTVSEPFPGAVLGNPNGSKVLVEFADYNCGYCKQSQEDVARLLDADPELKIVIREWPIFQGSEMASRMALAAAKQGKYAEFHEVMYRLAPATPETINQAAREVGLDMEQAQVDGAAPDVDRELASNYALAQQLGFSGTPSWVTSNQVFEGAVGFGALRKAIDSAGE